MLRTYLLNFLNLLLNAYMFLIFVRVLLSWVPNGIERIRRFVIDLTEPILKPIRKFIPPINGVFDLSPLIAYIILQVIQSLLLGI